MSSKILFIIESPGKVKKISQILGNNYIVQPTVGHITHIPTKKFSIDINTFAPTYEYDSKKVNVLNDIKKKYKNCNDVYLATDPDRAGERIASDVSKLLKLNNPKRIMFNEITKKGITDAMTKIKEIDNNLLNSQRAQESLDYIIGLKLSPELMKVFNIFNISAGRCMSVYTKLIYEKEQEIKDFYEKDNVSKYKIIGLFNLQELQIMDIKGTYYKMLDTKNEVIEIFNKISNPMSIDNVKHIIQLINPHAPLTTLAMQKLAATTLGYSSQQTMIYAQHLYEAGKISYIRTDNTTLPIEILDDIEKYIQNKYPNYENKKQYPNKSKNAQEGHSAIYPIHLTEIGKDDKIGINEIKLYDLIMRHTIASQMKPEKINKTTFKILINKDPKDFFDAIINTQIFSGFKILYKNEKEHEDNKLDIIKTISTKTQIKYTTITGTETYENPPTHYSESTFISKVEKLEIGRPSTMAMLINKIQKKEYVKKDNIKGFTKDIHILTLTDSIIKNKVKYTEETKTITIGEEKNKFIITDLGSKITKFLCEYFVNLMDYEFTANMEYDLTNIVHGKKTYESVLSNYYKIFAQELDKIKTIRLGISNNICVYDNANIELKNGKYGSYLQFKDIKISLNSLRLKDKDITQQKAIELVEKEISNKNGLGLYEDKPIQIKTGKFGSYIKWNGVNISIKDNSNISLEDAINLIKEKQKNKLMDFKDKNITYKVLNGPYGYYIQTKSLTGKSKNINISKIYLSKVQNKTLTLTDVKEIVLNYKPKKNYKKK